MLNNAPAEVKVGQHILRRLHLGHAHIGNNLLGGGVEVLNKQTAIDANILILNIVCASHIDLQHTQVLLLAEDCKGLVGERWSHNNLQEDWLHTECYLGSNLAIEGYDTAEDALGISLVSACPSLLDSCTDSGTARVHMLQRNAEWLVELANDIERCICILDVVVRELLTIQLLGISQREVGCRVIAIELSRLVRILAIAQRLLLVELEEELLRQACLLTHIGCDAHIVLCGVGVGLSRELQTSLNLGIALSLDLLENLCIVRRVAHYGHILVVLCCRTQHRRATDIDVLDSLSHLYALLGNGLTEWVEVDADHIDELDTILAQRLEVALQIATSQQTTVHLWVQGLYTTITDFWETCYIADADGLHSILLQKALGTACSDNLPAKRLQTADKLNQACLVANTYQCSHYTYIYIILFYLLITASKGQ